MPEGSAIKKIQQYQEVTVKTRFGTASHQKVQ